MPPRKRKDAPAAAPAIQRKAVRTRLYDVVGETSTHLQLENKEKFKFTHRKAAGDLVIIGDYTSTKKVCRTEAVKILTDCHTFFEIRFMKQDGSERHMYAHVRAVLPMCFSLKDLELNDNEVRQCRFDRIKEFIVKGVKYTVRQS